MLGMKMKEKRNPEWGAFSKGLKKKRAFKNTEDGNWGCIWIFTERCHLDIVQLVGNVRKETARGKNGFLIWLVQQKRPISIQGTA